MGRTPPDLGVTPTDQRTPKTRTFEHTGECVKCGSMESTLHWQHRSDPATYNEPTHLLYAGCTRCGYMWKVEAKDETDGTSRTTKIGQGMHWK